MNALNIPKLCGGDIELCNFFTGVDAPYEVPLVPEIRLDTLSGSAELLAEQVFSELRRRGIVD